MHLSDEQLLELNESDHSHLELCKSCRQRVHNLDSLRQRLCSMPEISLPKKNWQKIQRIQTQRIQTYHIKQTLRQVIRWKMVSGALVASIACLLFWFHFQSSIAIDNAVNLQIVSLIEENKNLQQLLDRRTILVNQKNVEHQIIQLELKSIDHAIQRAYLQDANKQLKTQLWKTRKQMVQQLLSITKKPQTLKI